MLFPLRFPPPPAEMGERCQLILILSKASEPVSHPSEPVPQHHDWEKARGEGARGPVSDPKYPKHQAHTLHPQRVSILCVLPMCSDLSSPGQQQHGSPSRHPYRQPALPGALIFLGISHCCPPRWVPGIWPRLDHNLPFRLRKSLWKGSIASGLQSPHHFNLSSFPVQSHLPQLEARCWGQELQFPLVLGTSLLLHPHRPQGLGGCFSGLEGLLKGPVTPHVLCSVRT